MSSFCVFVGVLGLSLFTFVLEWLVFETSDNQNSSFQQSQQQSQQQKVSERPMRLVDLLRANLGIDEWLNVNNNNNSSNSSISSNSTTAEHVDDVAEDANEDEMHWNEFSDVELIDEVEPMVKLVSQWSVADLSRWLALSGVCNDTLERVNVFLSTNDESPQSFILLRHAELTASLRRDSDSEQDAAVLARDVHLIALGNSMLRLTAVQGMIVEHCTQLLSGGDDDTASPISAAVMLLGEHAGVDVAQTLVNSLRFFMRVLVVAIKVLIALAVLIFFGPEGIGLTVLRLLLRAFVALMTVVAPAITLVFPRFRFRVQMPE